MLSLEACPMLFGKTQWKSLDFSETSQTLTTHKYFILAEWNKLQSHENVRDCFMATFSVKPYVTGNDMISTEKKNAFNHSSK